MSFETLTNQELTNLVYDLKMPETNTNEPVQKRSRSKPKNVEEKKTKPRERRSRSTSKSRSNSRKRTEVKGAKLYTKKDLEPKQEVPVEQPVVETAIKPAKRSLRSSSSTSTTSKLSLKGEIDPTQKQLDNSLVKEAEVSIIGQNIESSPEQQPRYSLRKRNSPISADKQSLDLSVQERSISSSSPLISQVDQNTAAPVAAKSKCIFANCGYLKFTHRQIINLVIISVLMIIALAVINYLNESTLSNLVDNVVQLKDQFVHKATDIVLNIRNKIGF